MLTLIIKSYGAAPPLVAIIAPETTTATFNTITGNIISYLAPFCSATAINADTSTPTIAQLSSFNSLLVFSDEMYFNSTQLSIVVQNFLSASPTNQVTLAPFDLEYDYGYYLNDGFPATWSPVINDHHTNYLIGSRQFLVADLPNDPLLQGVTSFDGGSASIHYNISVRPGAKLVAHWTDGIPLVVQRGQVVALNFFPPSNASYYQLWNDLTNGAQLMANAVCFPRTPLTISTSISSSLSIVPSPSSASSISSSEAPSSTSSPEIATSLGPNCIFCPRERCPFNSVGRACRKMNGKSVFNYQSSQLCCHNLILTLKWEFKYSIKKATCATTTTKNPYHRAFCLRLGGKLTCRDSKHSNTARYKCSGH